MVLELLKCNKDVHTDTACVGVGIRSYPRISLIMMSRPTPVDPSFVTTQTSKPSVRHLRRFRRGCKKYRTGANPTETPNRSVFLDPEDVAYMWMNRLVHRGVLRSTPRSSCMTSPIVLSSIGFNVGSVAKATASGKFELPGLKPSLE